MKRYLTSVFAVVAVLSSTAALADPGRGNDGWRNDGQRGNNAQYGRNNGNDKHWKDRDDRGRHDRDDRDRGRHDGYRPGYSSSYRPIYRPVYQPVYRAAPYVRAGHGYPPPPAYGYRRGGYAPAVYLEPRYAVRDYRAYRLAPPPPNYYWVQPVDGRYLLVQATTGLIAQALGY